MKGIRIQIAIYDQLVAEAIVEDYSTANNLWSKWCVARYRKGLPMGGAIMSLASSERYWKVPVGGTI